MIQMMARKQGTLKTGDRVYPEDELIVNGEQFGTVFSFSEEINMPNLCPVVFCDDYSFGHTDHWSHRCPWQTTGGIKSVRRDGDAVYCDITK